MAFGLLVSDLQEHWHDRWTSARVLAEALRVHFLRDPVVGGSSPAEPPVLEPDEAGAVRAADATVGLRTSIGRSWADDSLREMLVRGGVPPASEPATRPAHDRADSEAPEMRALLRAWVLDQEDYHYRAGEQHHLRHKVFHYVVAALFLTTMTLELVEAAAELPLGTAHAFDLLAIALPAAAAVLNSISERLDDYRHALRHRAARHQLSRTYLPTISGATSSRALVACARELGAHSLEEVSDWYTTMMLQTTDVPG